MRKIAPEAKEWGRQYNESKGRWIICAKRVTYDVGSLMQKGELRREKGKLALRQEKMAMKSGGQYERWSLLAREGRSNFADPRTGGEFSGEQLPGEEYRGVPRFVLEKHPSKIAKSERRLVPAGSYGGGTI